MYRGTTPTYKFLMPKCVDLTEASDVFVTFSNESHVEILTKTGSDLEITSEYVAVYLSQEETLSFPNGKVLVQLNWLYNESGIKKRACSNILTVKSMRNLKNEVL